MSKIDILNVEWVSSGRDVHIVEPVLCYLERKGYRIKRTSYLFALLKILFYRPRMVVLSNNSGSTNNFNASKFAYLLGVKTVALSVEGDYCIKSNAKHDVSSFFWGWDLQREFPLDLRVEWSQKDLDLIEKYIPDMEKYKNRIKISGATGFDRYKLLSFKKKEDFLRQYGACKYEKVIGYAAWGFDAFWDKDFCNAATVNYAPEYIQFHKKNRDLLRKVLNEVVHNNPEVLFIFKRHPGELIFEETELIGLEQNENVLMLSSEESIEDLINVCDFWMAYESTTCMEAWLLNKETVLINPISFTNNRSEIAQGSPVRNSSEDVQQDIVAGRVLGFQNLQDVRNEIIKKVIEYSDGKNYVRAGNYVVDELNKKSVRSISFNRWCLKAVLKEILKGMIFYSFLKHVPFFKRHVEDYKLIKKIYKDTERNSYTELYKKAINDIFSVE